MVQKRNIYIIPPNFAQEGTILSGRVRTRNALEAIILALLLGQMILSLNLSIKGKIYAGVIVLIPAVIFGIVGIQGDSLTSFVALFFRYLWNRRTLSEPDWAYRLKRNRRLMKQEEKRRKQEAKRRKKGGVGHRKRSKGTEAEVQGGKERREKADQGSKGTGA